VTVTVPGVAACAGVGGHEGERHRDERSADDSKTLPEMRCMAQTRSVPD
jgi:hypothetical protein